MTEFSFLTGVAGSGKSYHCQQQIAADPSWGVLSSTTGISALNLGTQTLNSILGYFDTESLRKIQYKGMLYRKLCSIREEYQRLVVDEVSMMDGEQLTILVEECDRAGLSLMVTGDFLQLPPVKAGWAFESPAWNRFEENTTRLTKVWRQDSGEFLNALNFARSGNGQAAAEILTDWHDDLDPDFVGTTLISKNEEVNQYNHAALDRLPGKEITLQNNRWGRQRAEFKHIPDQLTLKPDCYVMLLVNASGEQGDLSGESNALAYANGSCGHVVDFDGWNLRVKLLSGRVVEIERVIREVTKSKRPAIFGRMAVGCGEWMDRPHWNINKQHWVEGQLDFWPLKLAYASTIHRCQGLTLDRVQFDFRDSFSGQPAMCYTALSRCRTMQGLRLVGDKETFIKRCVIDPKVRRFV